MPALKSRTNAPSFELPLMGGGRFSLKDELSKAPIVLAFFKVSCPVCQYAFPLYERLSKSVVGAQVIGVSQNDESATRKFAKEYEITFPIALDHTRTYPVSNAYGLTNVPTLFEVAQDGSITLSCVGWDKAGVEEIARRHAVESRHSSLFSPAEQIADFRAG